MLHAVYAMSADELVIMAGNTQDALLMNDLGHGPDAASPNLAWQPRRKS